MDPGSYFRWRKASFDVLLLWHMHQPFYKDLVSGEYRLPWVRLHALKDYYGMVKLLEEFPQVHQNFNIVPSLVAQIEDYNSGIFKDPFWEVAAKPAGELSLDEKHFALTYFFQAHGEQMIGRYPRYRRLWEQVRAAGADPANAAITFAERDYRDLQVLSQLAWFDEYYLAEPAVRELIVKGQGYSEEDQRFVMSKQHEISAGRAAGLSRGVGARLGGAFDDAVLSPDSSAAVRHQHGPRVDSRDCRCRASASGVRTMRRSRYGGRWMRTSAASGRVRWECGRARDRSPTR